MAEEKHIVWSDINLDLEDWRDSLTEIYGDASEDFLYEKMCESNEMNFYDERANLNIQLPREIIVIADLGLWNGRFSGYKTIKSGNSVIAYVQNVITANGMLIKKAIFGAEQFITTEQIIICTAPSKTAFRIIR